ncbi:MAG: GNAT family N-acetyltransferase [Bacteroidota bacterium]
MNIVHKELNSKGFFIAQENGETVGEMTYSKAGDTKIIIDHTDISDQKRGSGLGKDLVFAAVEYAREKNIKILPLCPFAASVFNKHKEIRDVVV